MKELPCWTGTARCQKLLEQEIRKLQWKWFTDAPLLVSELPESVFHLISPLLILKAGKLAIHLD